MKVAIVGAGVMGTAMCWPIRDNGHQVNLIGTHLDNEIIASCKNHNFHPRLKRYLPDGVIPYFIEEVQQGIQSTDFIINGVNSLGVRWLGKTLSSFIKDDSKIISLTKGLEADRDKRLSIVPDIIRQELPESVRAKVSIGAVGGPCIANELAGRRQSCVVVGADNVSTINLFKNTCETSYYHIWPTNDLHGLEISAALKNAYAVAVGYAFGVLEANGGADDAGAFMFNLAAAIFAQACYEINLFLEYLGLSSFHTYSLPVAGDLYVTSQKGRSFSVGKFLGQGFHIDQIDEKLKGETLEAVLVINQMEKVLPKIRKASISPSASFPLMQFLIDTIVYKKTILLDPEKFFYSKDRFSFS